MIAKTKKQCKSISSILMRLKNQTQQLINDSTALGETWLKLTFFVDLKILYTSEHMCE